MSSHTVTAVRVAAALLQGALLHWLYWLSQRYVWPATDAYLFVPMMLVVLFVPAILIAGIGHLRIRTLLLWVGTATVLCAALGFYDRYRDGPGQPEYIYRFMPREILALALAAALFIAHTLITAAEPGRRFYPDYRAHFDLAWKHGLQLGLALGFVGVFWGVYWIGTEMFRLIGVATLYQLKRESWFWIPASTLAFAVGIHVTDVRPGIINGTRTLILTLLSWLLPLMGALVIAFLVTLVALGLEPLWSTRRATWILLAAAAALVLLINAMYQDGEPASPVVLRWAAKAAAVALVPLVAIAAYAVVLRVGQHGWTPQRIIAGACILVAACYALGYAGAALVPGQWLRGVRLVNVTTSYVGLALLFVLFTPIADPARIAVADQVARLDAGKVSSREFDFQFLRFDSGRYGRQALAELKTRQGNEEAVRIASAADIAQRQTSRSVRMSAPKPMLDPRSAITVVHPKDGTLPDAFFRQQWAGDARAWRYPDCLTSGAACDGVLLDIDDDAKPEILLFGPNASAAFRQGADGTWSMLGTIPNASCGGVRAAIRQGAVQIRPPELQDVEAAGRRLRVQHERCE
jgi:hypothetical protein